MLRSLADQIQSLVVVSLGVLVLAFLEDCVRQPTQRNSLDGRIANNFGGGPTLFKIALCPWEVALPETRSSHFIQQIGVPTPRFCCILYPVNLDGTLIML